MSKKVEKSLELNRIRVSNFRKRKLEVLNLDSSDDNQLNATSDSFASELNYSNPTSIESNNVIADNITDFDFSKDLLERNSHDFDDRFSSNDESEDDDSDCDDKLADSIINLTLLALQLRKWAFKCKLTHSSIEILLQILKPYHPELPLSAITLLKTQSKLKKEIKLCNPDNPQDKSQYVYFGIGKSLQRTVNVALHKLKVLKLQFNMDGVPLFKSSSVELWPILGKIFSAENYIYKPFIVSIHCGIGKPESLKNYLSGFIEEIKDLLKNGILIKGKRFKVELMCFICDRPARSYIKCLKGHGGYSACERCDVRGESYKDRIVYSISGNLRTDEDFRRMKDPAHHEVLGKISLSPLVDKDLPINMIHQFILDSMHLIFLGVIKKIMTECWLPSPHLRDAMLRLSQRLMNASSQVPREFQRTTRSLAEIQKWKATEYRFFLLYCPMLLKGLLTEKVYKHFLLLSVACRILSCDKLCDKYLDQAESYLRSFVKLMEPIYGKETLVLNVHSLIHVVQDLKNMRCTLSKMSAFPFENKLGLIKKYVKNGKQPLTQICNRLEQELELGEPEEIEISEIRVKQSKEIKSKLKFNIQCVQFYGTELTTKNPDNIILLNDNGIMQITKIESLVETPAPEEIYIYGTILKNTGPGLDYPPGCSKILDIYEVEVPSRKDSKEPIVMKYVSDIKTKMVLQNVCELPNDPQKCFVLPFLH